MCCYLIYKNSLKSPLVPFNMIGMLQDNHKKRLKLVWKVQLNRICHYIEILGISFFIYPRSLKIWSKICSTERISQGKGKHDREGGGGGIDRWEIGWKSPQHGPTKLGFLGLTHGGRKGWSWGERMQCCSAITYANSAIHKRQTANKLQILIKCELTRRT